MKFSLLFTEEAVDDLILSFTISFIVHTMNPMCQLKTKYEQIV